MSFILDALRKSEAERQRQTGPGLGDPGFRPPVRRRTLWLPLLVVALAANLVLMGWLWLRQAPAPAATGQSVAVAPAPAAAAPPLPTPSDRARAEIEALREDAPYQAMADIPAVEPEAMPAMDEARAEPAPAPAPVAEPVAGAVVTDDLPTAAQLEARGQLYLPPMHLDIHVFSDKPAERFVFINTRRYGEGALLTEGPRVEEITREGVVLSHGSQRFLLTRD